MAQRVGSVFNLEVKFHCQGEANNTAKQRRDVEEGEKAWGAWWEEGSAGSIGPYGRG
jgi:hypothetical protein